MVQHAEECRRCGNGWGNRYQWRAILGLRRVRQSSVPHGVCIMYRTLGLRIRPGVERLLPQ